MKTDLVSVERLRERLELVGGVLYWRRCPSMPKQWNSVWAGREAFTAVDGKGYRHGSLDYTYVRLHRALWAMTYGAWPKDDIDHVDGDRSNNDISNLRLVTASDNQRNQKRYKNNTSGHTGVSWYKPYSKWRATICLNGKHKHLGYFDTAEEAAKAREKASNTYGFHANHGKR
jgi:hypothetical protein